MYMTLKLDMRKAYDRVEWDFLEGMIRKIGFVERCIQLTMTCIRTDSYSMLINNKPHGLITPSRGLKQSDPLSYYLFIPCEERSSSIIHMVEQNRMIICIPIIMGWG
jgi:hypothetical protein